MIWGRIQSNWNHYKVAAKVQWSKLTDEQLDGSQGDRARLTDREPGPYGRRTASMGTRRSRAAKPAAFTSRLRTTTSRMGRRVIR